MTPLTPSEQREILLATHPKELHDVTANIDYLAEMVRVWMLGTPWTVKMCPSFNDVCGVVLGDDPAISKDLYGTNEASLRALATLKMDDPVRYHHERERTAVTWLWREQKGTLSQDYLMLPKGLLEPF